LSWRAIVIAAASLAFAVALLVLLARHAGIDLAALLRVLGRAKPVPLALLGLLAALLAALSAERWRMIERHTEHAPPPPARAFGLTAVGVGLGQFLPVQVSTALSRMIGARILKPGLSRRPIVVTLYEQAFDVGLALSLAPASLVSLALHGAVPWLLVAAPMVILAYVFAGAAAGSIGWLCAWAVRRGRGGAWLQGLTGADLFSARLARRLMLLSAARFAVTATMAGLTSWAAGLEVSLQQLVAVLPLVVLATAAPLTPAGLGVNEWTFAGGLALLGVSPTLAAQWALVNRLFVFAVSVVLGAAALVFLLATEVRLSRRKLGPTIGA
jgi:uncharacterized membrane protein YbhN (UPF0104 family)